MRIDQLRQIVIVSETKSINAAAKELFLSQSGLSASISSMEKELGGELLIRSHDGIEMSPYGVTFVETAKEILSLYERVLSLDSAPCKGKLQISSQFLLYASTIFTNMHSEYEDAISSFRFAEKTSSGVIQDLINRVSEIGLIVTRSELHKNYLELADKCSLHYHVISTDESQCLVGRGSPLFSIEENFVTPEQLKPFPSVHYEVDSHAVEKKFDLHEEYTFPHTGTLVISDTGSLQNILARTNGYFIGIHNANAYSKTDFYENIRVLSILDKAFTFDTAWLYPKGQVLTPMAKEFLRRVYLAVGNSPDILSEL